MIVPFQSLVCEAMTTNQRRFLSEKFSLSDLFEGKLKYHFLVGRQLKLFL